MNSNELNTEDLSPGTICQKCNRRFRLGWGMERDQEIITLTYKHLELCEGDPAATLRKIEQWWKELHPDAKTALPNLWKKEADLNETASRLIRAVDVGLTELGRKAAAYDRFVTWVEYRQSECAPIGHGDPYVLLSEIRTILDG